MSEEMNFEEWFRYGLKNSFCGPPICPDHDGIPYTDEEMEWLEENGEICVSVVRLYADELERMLIEQAHSPSVWRRFGWE